MATPMEVTSIREALKDLPDWKLEGDKLTKSFKFGSFREAMGFLTRIGFEAEERNHHPEIFNVYNQVTLSLSTHDAGGKVTEKDTDLAGAIERIDWS